MSKLIVNVGTGQQERVALTPEEEAEQQARADAWAASSIVYSDALPLSRRLRTTDATPAELYRATLRLMTGYRASLRLLAVDTGNGAVRSIEARTVAKRLAGGALLVGAPVVVANHQDAAASAWAVAAEVAGNDFVVTVTGAAGRTIDWLLDGDIVSFTPSGR